MPQARKPGEKRGRYVLVWDVDGALHEHMRLAAIAAKMSLKQWCLEAFARHLERRPEVYPDDIDQDQDARTLHVS
jgi:hypothetical protein